MTGYLRNKHDKNIGERRVGRALAMVSPAETEVRRTSTRRAVNPIPYRADYFGHKLHIDQNEKISMFGVTHVCAIDGYSGRIVGFVSMPIKSNQIIYEFLYR